MSYPVPIPRADVRAVIAGHDDPVVGHHEVAHEPVDADPPSEAAATPVRESAPGPNGSVPAPHRLWRPQTRRGVVRPRPRRTCCRPATCRGRGPRRLRAGPAARHRDRPQGGTRTRSRDHRTPRRPRRRAHLHQPAPRRARRARRALLSEIGDVRARFPDEQSLAALAGVAPVTRASGKMHAVGFRNACDKKLRTAIVDFADDSRNASPWADKGYQDAIDRGKRHPYAVRILAAPGSTSSGAAGKTAPPATPNSTERR